MQITNLQRQVAPAEIPLERMADSNQVSEQQKLGEVSRQFEAILIRQILNEAQKSQTSLTGKSGAAVSDIYRDMVTNQLADSISRTGSVGLGKSLEKQLGRQLHPAAASENSSCDAGVAVSSNLPLAAKSAKPL